MKFFPWRFRWSPVLAVLLSTSTLANDDWWFDVEVIAFERKVALDALEEQFDFSQNLSSPPIDTDVIGQVIAPNISWLKQGLAVCNEAKVPVWPEIIVYPREILPLANASEQSEQPNAELAIAESSVTETLASEVNASSKVDANLTDASTPSGELTEKPNEGIETIANEGIENTESTEALALEASDDGLSLQEYAEIWLALHNINFKDNKKIDVAAFSYCEKKLPWITYEDNTWHIHRPDNRLPAPAQLPITPEGQDWTNARHAHLLTKDAQQLTNLSRQIRQSGDLGRLLHVVWRQPVKFGEDNAFNIRLFAGKNYATEFNLDGTYRAPSSVNTDTQIAPAPTNRMPFEELDNNVSQRFDNQEAAPLDYASAAMQVDDFFEQLDQKLASPKPVSFNDMTAENLANIVDDANEENLTAALRTPIWQLDGNLKVFLKYINNVPYLHIDNNLLYRQPVSSERLTKEHSTAVDGSPTQEQLVSLSFNEQRRVISKQLHYFDHPLFGIIVQIRRYHPPRQSVESDVATPERID